MGQNLSATSDTSGTCPQVRKHASFGTLIGLLKPQNHVYCSLSVVSTYWCSLTRLRRGFRLCLLYESIRMWHT